MIVKGKDISAEAVQWTGWNAAGEVHNLIVCMRERHPNMTLSNTEAREREFRKKACRCRRKAKKWR